MIIQPEPAELASLFFRRHRLFAVVMALVLALGATYLILVTPKYRSMASVVVRFDDKSTAQTDIARDTSPSVTAQSDRHETVLAHADILNSPDMAIAVINQVGLARAYPKIAGSPPARGTPMDAALLAFQRSLVVDPEQQGDVISITFDHPDPQIARTVVRDLIDAYMQREAHIFSHPDLDFQKAQVAQAETRLRQAQTELRDYKARSGITSFDDETAALIKQRADTSGALQSALVSETKASRRRDELQRLIAGVPASLVNSASGEKYRSLDDAQSTLDGLKLKAKQMRATYREDSPVLDQLRAAISAASSDLGARRGGVGGRDSTTPNLVFQNIQTDLLRATADAQAESHAADVLTSQVADLDRRLHELEAQHTGLAERSRAVELADSAFRALSLHLEDARVDDGRFRDGISHAAIVSEASLPYKPSKPRYTIMAAAFAVASLLAAVTAVVLAELMDDRFATPGQVARMLGIPVLGTFGDSTARV